VGWHTCKIHENLGLRVVGTLAIVTAAIHGFLNLFTHMLAYFFVYDFEILPHRYVNPQYSTPYEDSIAVIWNATSLSGI
jgi:hypothetical protein